MSNTTTATASTAARGSSLTVSASPVAQGTEVYPKELNMLLQSCGMSGMDDNVPDEPSVASSMHRLFDGELLPQSHPEAKEVTKDMDSDFQVAGVFRVFNKFRSMAFQVQAAQVMTLSKERDANIQTLWHCTKMSSVVPILNLGMDVAHSNSSGFFGKGLYFTSDPMKANDYCGDKGSPHKLRAVLRCQVALGKCKEFELGCFDRSLVTVPPGFQSVMGYIRRGPEYVVYSNNQVLVTHVIIYRFLDPKRELAPCMNHPPNVNGQVVFITAALSEFFSKLHARAGSPGSSNHSHIRKAIALLLRSQITPEHFIQIVGGILKAASPEGLVDKLKADLAKCKLPTAANTVSSNNEPPLASMAPPSICPVSDAPPAQADKTKSTWLVSP